MRIARIVVHLAVTGAIVFLVLDSLQEILAGNPSNGNWFLIISATLLFFAAMLGLILEFRSRPAAAFLNPSIPALLAIVIAIDAFRFAELEGAGFLLILDLVPVFLAFLQGTFYYISWTSNSAGK